jgi:uncharacterized membrane protein YeiH
VTALGGGTLRDLLLDIHPVFWVRQPVILWSTIIAAALALVTVRFLRPPWKALLVADALGLAFFSIVGVQVAESAGEGGLVAVVMGLLTGVAGGVLRDMMSGEVPLLFRPSETLYATASLAGISCYLLAQPAGLARGWAALAGMVVILALRLTAIVRGLRLPALEVPPPPEESAR